MNPLVNLSELFLKENPQQSVDFLQDFNFEDLLAFLNSLDEEILAFILPYFNNTMGSSLLNKLEKEKVPRLLERLAPEVVAKLLRGKDNAEIFLDSLEEGKKENVKHLLSIENETVGALIDSFPLCVREYETIQETFKKFQSNTQKAIYYIYILNSQGVLIGVTTVKELAHHLDKSQSAVSEIMISPVAALKAHSPKIQVIEHLGWKRFHALPVVDKNSKYLGTLRYKTLIKLEDNLAKKETNDLKTTGKDIGTLFSIGFLSFFKGANSLLEYKQEEERHNG